MLAAIVAVGAAFRFYNLAWGAPYYHFHMDEHFVLGPADTLRRDVRAAAMGSKFFMYSPMMMYLINIVRGGYEALFHPLDLTVPAHQVTYMVLSRAIAAAFGTATIVVVYAIATRIAGRVAGLLAAFFLACAVLHLRDSHFATTDMPMVFFCMVTVWWSLRVAERGDWLSLIGAGASVGAAVASKYTGLLSLGVVGVAYLLSPLRPRQFRPLAPWAVWVVKGLIPICVAVATFFLLDPLVLWYPDKFLLDFREQVTDPLTGVTRPIIFAQFADIANPRLFWLSNLWWSLGPMLEILGIAWRGLADRQMGCARGRRRVVPDHLLPRGRPDGRADDSLHAAARAGAGHRGGGSGRRRHGSPSMARRDGVRRGGNGPDNGPVRPRLHECLQAAGRSPGRLKVARRECPGGFADSRRTLAEHTADGVVLHGHASFGATTCLWGGRSRREAERERKDYYHLFTLDTYRYLYADRYDDAEKMQIYRVASVASRLDRHRRHVRAVVRPPESLRQQ